MGFLDTLSSLGSALSAPISAGVSFYNSIAGSNAAEKVNRENRLWQERQNAISYERQKELTMLSPQLQKLGLQNAGISTAAMNGYTGGTASVSAANNAPSPQSEFVPFDMNSFLQSLQVQNQSKVADADVKLKESEAALNDKQSGRYDELTDASIEKIKSDISRNDRAEQLDAATIREINARIPLLNNQTDYWNYLAQLEDINYQKSAATYQSEIDSLRAQFKLSKEEAETRLRYVSRVVDAEFKLILANIYNARASGQAQLSNAYTNRLNYDLENSFKDLRANIMRWQGEDIKQGAFNKEKEGRYYGIDKETQIMLRNKLIDKFRIDNEFAPFEKAEDMILKGVNGASSLSPKSRLSSVSTVRTKSRHGTSTSHSYYEYE